MGESILHEGNFLSGAGLVWAIYTFVVNKRDKAHQQELLRYSEFQQKILSRLEGIEKNQGGHQTALAVQKEKIDNLTRKLDESLLELRATVRDHGAKLDHLRVSP